MPRRPDALRHQQTVFERTGGLHAAALFDAKGHLVLLREDVGRHNAVDKLIGAEFLRDHTPLHDKLILLSGRVSFQLTQKPLMAGSAFMAAVGGPSRPAASPAKRFHIT